MAWDTYLMVGAGATSRCSGFFEIHDFSQFSFDTGEGPWPAIYSDDTSAYDFAYHEGQGVIYVSRGEGGLEVMEAPFPTLNNHIYFPAAPLN